MPLGGVSKSGATFQQGQKPTLAEQSKQTNATTAPASTNKAELKTANKNVRVVQLKFGVVVWNGFN